MSEQKSTHNDEIKNAKKTNKQKQKNAPMAGAAPGGVLGAAAAGT